MSKEIRSAFEKQRRNLVLIGAAVFFVELTDIKFETINILGNSAKIDSPELVVTGMWVLLVYWLIRFLNYFHDLEDIGFENSFFKFRNHGVLRYLLWSYPRKKEVKKWVTMLDSDRSMQFFYDRHDVDIDRLLRMKLEIGFLMSDHRDGGGGIHSEKFSINGWGLLLPNIYAFLRSVFLGRYFGEYVFPFIVVALAVLARFGIFDVFTHALPSP